MRWRVVIGQKSNLLWALSFDNQPFLLSVLKCLGYNSQTVSLSLVPSLAPANPKAKNTVTFETWKKRVPCFDVAHQRKTFTDVHVKHQDLQRPLSHSYRGSHNNFPWQSFSLRTMGLWVSATVTYMVQVKKKFLFPLKQICLSTSNKTEFHLQSQSLPAMQHMFVHLENQKVVNIFPA